jgi:hypothetical protein
MGDNPGHALKNLSGGITKTFLGGIMPSIPLFSIHKYRHIDNDEETNEKGDIPLSISHTLQSTSLDVYRTCVSFGKHTIIFIVDFLVFCKVNNMF